MLAWLLALVARALLSTLRVTFVDLGDPSQGTPRLYAFHHGRQFALHRLPQPRGMTVMVSHSRDGTVQTGVLAGLGLTVVRGSSSRGGAQGLRGIVRHVRHGMDGAFAVDGPKGPYGAVKEGVLTAARLSGAAIVPVAAAVSHAWVFNGAWDHFVLPLPFARVVIVAGAPLVLDRHATDDTVESCRRVLDVSLRDLAVEAERRVGEGG